VAVRQNLAQNPACKNNATGWASSPTGWARSTSVDAGLSRTTGFEGTTGVDVLPPRAPVTAGQQYIWSIQVKANVAMVDAEMLVNYYTALSGGSFVANSGTAVPLTLAAGAIARFEVGPYTVPATATAGYLKLNDIDGAAEVTAYMVEKTTTLGRPYFDGDSPGASWDGTSGNSSSTLRDVSDTFTFGQTFSVTPVASGPVHSDTFALSSTWSVDSTTTIADAFATTDGFLIASLSFDEARGRVRIEAFTFGPTVTIVRVSSRTATSKYSVVRGGLVNVLDGLMARPVDDYEYVAGVDTEYLIEGLNDVGVAVQRATVIRAGANDSAWLKFIAMPSLNRRITLTDWSEVSRQSRTGLFQVQGRSTPIVASDVHSSREVTISCVAADPAQTAELDVALSQGAQAYLQIPASVPLPSMYVAIGDYRYARPSGARRSVRGIFEIPLTEIDAPSAEFAGAFTTWQSVLDGYPTWGAVYDEVDTWRELAA
jgi:hypothetical protein